MPTSIPELGELNPALDRDAQFAQFQSNILQCLEARGQGPENGKTNQPAVKMPTVDSTFVDTNSHPSLLLGAAAQNPAATSVAAGLSPFRTPKLTPRSAHLSSPDLSCTAFGQ